MENYESFVEEFQKQLEEKLSGVDAKITRFDLDKSLNSMRDTLSVQFGDMQTAPVVYLDDVYDMYLAHNDMQELTDNVSESLKDFYFHPPEVPDFSLDAVRDKIYSSLINADMNSELLKTVPHEDMLDLAIVPRLRFEDKSLLITNDLSTLMGLTGEEVLELAKKNMEANGYVLNDLGDMVAREAKQNGMSQPEGIMYYLSNPEGIDGAIVATSNKTMQEVCNEIGEGVYVLPSSRHEVLLIPESCAPSVDNLQSMVQHINKTELLPRDVLSNNVYHFDGRKLTLATERAKEATKEVAKVVKQVITRR